MASNHLINLLDDWIAWLDKYNFEQLVAKPSARSWSMGQLYNHIIESTEHFVNEAKRCMVTPENGEKEMSPSAKVMFNADGFPDELIVGPATNEFTLQPDSREDILQRLNQLKNKTSQVQELMQTKQGGKTPHPGLMYFDAPEWIKFAEMHLRHHFKQKNRIDSFLKMK